MHFKHLKFNLIVGLLSLQAIFNSLYGEEIGKPLFISDITVFEDTSFAVLCKAEQSVRFYNSTFGSPQNIISLPYTPTGIISQGEWLYITTFDNTIGRVLFVNSITHDIATTLPVGSGTSSPLLSADGTKLYVLNQFSNTISEINLKTRTPIRQFSVLREPKAAVIDKSGRFLYVNNFLPAQRADVDTVAACISIIDLETGVRIKDIQLYNGSNALRGIALSNDGKYIFVTHNLGRFQVPTSQLQQGWMNTSAMSIISTETQDFYGTVLLDEPERGAAGIWGIQCTSDNIVISHSGTHELSVINYDAFIKDFEAYKDKQALAYDLRFLYNTRIRYKLNGNAPRNLIIHNNKAIVNTYFSDTIHVLDLKNKKIEEYPLVANRVETKEQRGEKYFNDATYCFQQWQSCNGCHPGDARTDGMNWDLMNDGIGNPKNCKSMLYSHATPPSMISGIRLTANLAVRKGYSHIQFAEIPEEYATCVDAYLMALKPVTSPFRIDGELSEKAKKGAKVFEKLECASCHSGPYFTDLQMYRIGENIEFENGWDTPTLIEVWRTAPYLFDGKAATLEDVFSLYKHGINKKISNKDIEALVEYVKSL